MSDPTPVFETIGSFEAPLDVSDDSDAEVVDLTASQVIDNDNKKVEENVAPDTPNKTIGSFFKAPLKPVKDSEINTTSSPLTGPTSVRKMTPKQLEKQNEREEREKKKLEEKLAREKAKEDERKMKEEKRLQKEAEKKAKEEERERLKREIETKRELAKKEKEERETKRLEGKLRKEEERLKREEEKRQKEEERIKKEEEKRQKEEDSKKKKEKLKISNFFKQKTVVKSTIVTEIPSAQTKKNGYETTFQKFFVRDGVTLCGSNRLMEDSLKKSVADFDDGFKDGDSDLCEWFKSQDKSDAVQVTQTAEYIYENQIISAPLHMKFIRFYENVKGWIGTYTKNISEGLGKDPLRELPEFIDFDDDAGEDEEGEGEDIDDDDDASEGDEEECDDLQDFLEDDNSNGDTRKKFIGPLIPVVSWKGRCSDPEVFVTEPVVRIEIIRAEVTFPIDPMKDYWAPPPSATTAVEDDKKTTGSTSDEQPKKKAKSVITVKEDLETFALKVQGCDFTVPTMVEILKKELPKYTKATIENTLRSLAKRVGPKPTEKKWEVNREVLDQVIETATN